MDRRLQTSFASALLDVPPTVPAEIARTDGADPRSRFEVYRNNVQSALASALSARFPATEQVVGTPFFRAMALAYARAHPPRSPLLLNYGDGMPAFVSAFPPAQALPYLADLMRLEVLRGRAYHAADCGVLDPARLASCPVEAIESLRLRLHPSAGWLSSPYPVLTVWRMNSGLQPLAPIADRGGEDVLVVRPHLTLHVHALPQGTGAFLTALADGLPLGPAASRTAAEADGFDLHETLAFVLSCGVLADLEESSLP